MFKELERRHYRKFFYFSGFVILILGYQIAAAPMLVWAFGHMAVGVWLEE